MDIEERSNKKRWFGFKTKDMQKSESALLVYWNTEPIDGQKEAFIYATGEGVVGTINELLDFVHERVVANHLALTGREPPKPMVWGEGPNERRRFDFFTQAWQGETEATTTKNVIYVNPHDNADYWHNYANGVLKWKQKQLSRQKGNRLAKLANIEKAARPAA